MGIKIPFLPGNHPKAKISLRLRLPLLSFVLLTITAFILPDRVWNTLLIGLGGMFVVAYGWVWFLSNGIEAERRLRARWVSVGDLLEETFVLWNHSQFPALWVEVIDHSNVPGYQAAIVRSPGIERADRWLQKAVCLQRGQYQIGPWLIRTSDPFGIFMADIHYPQITEIIIHPPIHTQIPVKLPAGQSSGRKRARQRSWQATINAATVRSYTPGDPKRWIHWPTTARRDLLMVREFDLDAVGDIWILLDMQAAVQLGEGIDGTEEQAVLLAASLAARALRQNRAVGIATYGRHPQIIASGHGSGQEWRILRALALAKADGDTSLESALRDLGRNTNRGSAAVVISADPETSWVPQLLQLTKQGIESTVILLDRPSFGGSGNAQVQREAVQQIGYDCFVIHQGDIGTPVQEQTNKEAYRVTPMGKVVAVTN